MKHAKKYQTGKKGKGAPLWLCPWARVSNNRFTSMPLASRTEVLPLIQAFVRCLATLAPASGPAPAAATTAALRVANDLCGQGPMWPLGLHHNHECRRHARTNTRITDQTYNCRLTKCRVQFRACLHAAACCQAGTAAASQAGQEPHNGLPLGPISPLIATINTPLRNVFYGERAK